MVDTSSYTRPREGRSAENLIAVALSLAASAGFGAYCLLYFAGLFPTAS